MTFQKYTEYKDSGVVWLGLVPAHWPVQPLKRHSRLLTEKTDRRGNPVALENIESWTGRHLPTDTEFEGDGVAFDAGDILFGKLRPYLAKALVADAAGEAVGDFLVIRADERVVPKFARYQMLSREFISIVDGSTFGSKMPRASWDFVGAMRLPLAPSIEQEAIVRFLDRETAKVDALVEDQKCLIDLLKEKRQAVISQAVTKGLDPNMPTKDSGVEWLGKVPAHWRVLPLKHIVHLKSGGTPDKSRQDYWDGEIPWASAKDLKVDALFDTIDHITDAALRDGVATLIDAGVVLVVVRGMILARLFPVVTIQVPMAINQDLKAVSARAQARNDWLAWLLRASSVETLSRLDEAAHGTKALRMDAWGDMRVAVPPSLEQLNIAAFLRDECAWVDELVAEAGSAMKLLAERRSALISAAVTGKIDVRGLVPQPEAVAA